MNKQFIYFLDVELNFIDIDYISLLLKILVKIMFLIRLNL